MREARARRVLALLLRLYPRAFRWDVGADLLATTVDRWRDAHRSAGRSGEALFWLREGVRFAVDGVIERTRAVMAGGATELRHAARQLARAPRHYALAVATLALGTGATTTIFTIADAVVFRPLPYADADRLYLVRTRLGALELSSNSLPNLRDTRAAVPALEWLAGAADRSPALTDGVTAAERVSLLDVTDAYLPGLGARVLLGRSFAAHDFAADAGRVAIVSHALWQRRWGGDASVIGSRIELDAVAYDVVGVMHPSFRDPEPIESGSMTGVWTPTRGEGGAYGQRDYYAFQIIGRLADGASADIAGQQLAAVSAALASAHPDANRSGGDAMHLVLRPLQQATVGDARARLLLLLGAVMLLLLLSCANVAGLFLTRGLKRSPELAVRSALGASRARLAAQLFGESLLTALIACLLGLVIAWYGVQAFLAVAPAGMPRLHEVVFDARVISFVIVLAVATAVVFGTLPAARGAATALHGGAGRGVTPARGTQRFLSALLGAEVALSLVLLTGAALLLNSVRHLLSVEQGFVSDDVLAIDVRPPRSASSHAQELLFYDALAARVAAVPGVQQTALLHSVPGVHGGAWSKVLPDHARSQAAPRRATAPVRTLLDPGDDYYRLNPVRGDVFGALGIPILAGRTFEGEPGPGETHVVILNEAAAQRLFPYVERPVGRMIAIGEPGSDVPLREVVGISGNVRQRGAAHEPDAQVYLPYGQRDISRMSLLVRLAPGAIMDAALLRQAVHDVAAGVPVDRVERVSDRYAATSATHRLLAALLTVFAVLGLIMALVGTYATAAQAAARRTREFGVRVALGAVSGDLLRMVLAGSMLVAGAGLACGLVATLALARLLDSYVFGISVRDPLTFAVAAMLITVSVTTASLLPALRAARVDPNSVLRSE